MKTAHRQDLYAIIVGSCADEFVSYTMDLLGGLGVEFVVCGDVYGAVVELAKNNGFANVLVAGRLEQLSREDGRFFQKASDSKSLCVCLADTSSLRKYLQSLSFIGTEAFVITRPTQVKGIVKKLLLSDRDVLSEEKVNEKASTFNRDEFLTTKAEIDALLGGLEK